MTTPRWRELLAALEDPMPEVEAKAMSAWVRRRQKIVDELQALDASNLSTEERKELHHRLGDAKARGDALIDQIRENQETLRSQIVSTTKGRAALRGYRTAREAEPKTRGRSV